MKRLTLLMSALLLLSACNKQKYFEGPDAFSDDFEGYSKLEDMLSEDRWSFFQVTEDENQISLASDIVHSGNQSVRFQAQKSANNTASKCSIVKQKMAFWEGETVLIDFWVYLQGNETADWIFLADLEEQTPIGAGPGMRLANTTADNHLVMEHKYPAPNVHQDDPRPLPRDEWVHLEMEVHLSTKKEGHFRVWQNEELILARDNWQTLPQDVLYSIQGSKGMYSSVELGITANTYDNDMVLYLDDVEVSLKK